MRITSALHWPLLLTFLATPIGALAQDTTADRGPLASLPRPLSEIVQPEDQIYDSIYDALDLANQVGLEVVMEAETDQLTQRLRQASSLADTERLPVLSQLAREAADLAGTIRIGQDYLSLRGPRVTDAWLDACAPHLTHTRRFMLYGTAVTDAGLAHLHSLESLAVLVLRSPDITGSGLKFLSNVPLTAVDFTESGATDEGLESIAAFRQIESIELGNTGVTDAGLRHLAGLKELRSLSLRGTAITDAGLTHLQDLTALESLTLASTAVTGSGLKDLSGASLTTINFRDSGVTDAGLASIAGFQKLELIFLDRTGVTGAGLRHLAGMKSLEQLSLQSTAITDEGVSHLRALSAMKFLNLALTDVSGVGELSELRNLVVLDISETRVNDGGLAGLGALPNLEMLFLPKTNVLGPGLAGFKDAKKLWLLDLNDTRVNDAGLAPLAELPLLTHLKLSSTRITDATLDRFARAGRLTFLNIYGTNVTADGIRRLGALQGLTELYAGGTAADDLSIAALTGLIGMFHLDLQGTRITDASFESIGKFKHLNSLNLSDTAITGSTISKLSGIHELRTLNLAGTRATDDAVTTIARILVREVQASGAGGGFAWLNRLILTDTNVSDEGLEHISLLKHLMALHLDGTSVGDNGMEHIARLPQLQHLMLDGTAVTDVGLAALTNSGRLVSLSLNGTGITDEALSRLGDPIQRLALSHTHVSDAGVRMLESRVGLQELELAGTAVTDRALETITLLPNLRVIDLSATTISDRGVAKLQALPVLSQLRLDRTGITDQAAESLALFGALGEVSLEGTRVTGDGKALLLRRRPELAVELDSPRADSAWAGVDPPDEAPWSSSELPEDTGVTELDRLSAVRSLSLQHRTVDAESLVALRDLSDLESLDLADTSVDDDLLANLVGLPRLRALRLSRTAISDDGLLHLAGLATLERLDLDGTRVTGAGLRRLEGLTKLRSIRLCDTLLRDEHASHLAALRSLRQISAQNTRLGDAAVRELERLPALQYLDLYGTNVGDAGLESIGRMSSLSHLYVSETNVTDQGLAALVGLVDLVELGIDGTKITDRGLEVLTGFRHLERLRLNGTRISDAGVKTISETASLRKLELNDTTVSDASVGNLLKLPALRELELNGTALSDRGLEELGSLASLKILSIRDTDVSPAGRASFVASRPGVTLTFQSQPSEFSWVGIALAVFYGLIAIAICLYGAHRYFLVWLYVRHRGVRSAQAPVSEYSELPRVTIQIPLFNERNVAERIIAAACAFDYPRDRLQIQVLDDSTDDCTEVVRRRCERFRSEGVDVVCLHRDSREGFKSGALAAGLQSATGELVAIFDADFVPAPDFLRRTVHHFTDERVGVVQAEWRHLNRDESLLTQCQAMFLDGHLVLEQAIRARTGRWFNFNGTAGLWRRTCIDEAGGWRHDTLTEDTDLSYRAQLAGWRFVYLPDVHADAELPSTMTAFLSQQHRWTRGLLQCAVKLIPRILASKAPLRVKAEAFFHLTAPIMYLVMFVLAAIAVPATFVALPLSQLRGAPAWAIGSAVLLGGTLAAAVFVLVAQRAAGQSVWRTLARLPALMALGVGMSAVNTRAAVGALVGVRSPFVRTPKFGGRSDSEVDPDARRGPGRPPAGAVELVVAGVLVACLLLGLSNDFSLVGAPFLLRFAAGFLWVGGARVVESGRRVTMSPAVHVRALRWSVATAVVGVTVGVVLGTDSMGRAPKETVLASRVAGVNLTRAGWQVRGSSVTGAEARIGGLTLDVDLDPEAGAREQGEIFIDLTGPLAPLGASLAGSRQLVFDITYPRGFAGELQAFATDTEGKSQYGSIEFVERQDVLRRVRVGIAPGSFTPAMGYTDPGFVAQRSIQRVGLKVSAQSDRVRGRGYRPFRGELAVTDVRLVPRGDWEAPEIRTVPADRIHRPQPSSPNAFLASSGADRPWPLGYAFSGPISEQQRETLEQTYAALQRQGLGFTRVYIGDYRTGLVFDAEGSVTAIEPQFLEFLDALAEIANRHGIIVMFSLMDNTVLDGKGVEFPQFVIDHEESERFVKHGLAPIIERLAGRRVIWDLFNEPENVSRAQLSQVQDFVDRALAVLRATDADARFTVVSRSADELIYWRGRGLDVLSHNVFDQRGLDAAVNLADTIELDAPVWIAEMDPKLATAKSLEALRRAGYRGVGLWGWGTGDKYDWSADQLERIVSPLVPAQDTSKP